MVKLQYLPLVAVLRSASLLRIAVCQIAPLPALLVPAPKERLFLFDTLVTLLIHFIMSVLDVCQQVGHMFCAKSSKRDAMALLPYAFLKLAIRKSLRIIAFCLLVRLAMMFIFSSSVR